MLLPIMPPLRRSMPPPPDADAGGRDAPPRPANRSSVVEADVVAAPRDTPDMPAKRPPPPPMDELPLAPKPDAGGTPADVAGAESNTDSAGTGPGAVPKTEAGGPAGAAAPKTEAGGPAGAAAPKTEAGGPADAEDDAPGVVVLHMEALLAVDATGAAVGAGAGAEEAVGAGALRRSIKPALVGGGAAAARPANGTAPDVGAVPPDIICREGCSRT